MRSASAAEIIGRYRKCGRWRSSQPLFGPYLTWIRLSTPTSAKLSDVGEARMTNLAVINVEEVPMKVVEGLRSELVMGSELEMNEGMRR